MPPIVSIPAPFRRLSRTRIFKNNKSELIFNHEKVRIYSVWRARAFYNRTIYLIKSNGSTGFVVIKGQNQLIVIYIHCLHEAVNESLPLFFFRCI